MKKKKIKALKGANISTIINDPVEKNIALALEGKGLKYQHNMNGFPQIPLDFYIPELKLHIEGKAFYSERVLRQLSKEKDVILIQGYGAAEVFKTLLGGAQEAKQKERLTEHDITKNAR